MIDLNCKQHQCRGFAVCTNPECHHRFICREDECLPSHIHGGFEVRLIHMNMIRQKRELMRPIQQTARSIIEECLNGIRKSMELALHVFFRETPCIREFDLDQIPASQLLQFMEVSTNDSSIIQQLQKLSKKLTSEVVIFKQECIKRYSKPGREKSFNEGVDSVATDEKELNTSSGATKKKKKNVKQQVVILTASKQPNYIETIPIGCNPIGLRNVSQCIQLIEDSTNSELCSQVLFEFLKANEMSAGKRLFLASAYKFSNNDFFKCAHQVKDTLLLISCVTSDLKNRRMILGQYQHRSRTSACQPSLDSFMFLVNHEQATKYSPNYKYQSVCNGTDWRQTSTTMNIMLGVGDFTLSNQCNKYKSFIQANKLYGLSSTLSVKVIDFELIKIDRTIKKTEILYSNKFSSNISQITKHTENTMYQTQQEFESTAQDQIGQDAVRQLLPDTNIL